MEDIRDKPDDGSTVVTTIPKRFDLTPLEPQYNKQDTSISKFRKPNKFTAEVTKEVLKTLAIGLPADTAAERSGITWATLKRWWEIGKEVDDEEQNEDLIEMQQFYIACMKAKGDNEAFMVLKIREAIIGKQQVVTNKGDVVTIENPDGHLALKALPILHPDKYGPGIQKVMHAHAHVSKSTHEHTGTVSVTMPGGTTKAGSVDLSKLSEDELDKLLEMVSKAKGEIVEAEIISDK